MTRRFHQSAIWLAIVLTAALANSAAAQSALTDVETQAVDAAVADQMEIQKAVGVAVGVIRNGDVAFLKGYGFQDREQKLPMTTESMVRWASVSKTLTAIAALQLMERGGLSLVADIRSYVPEFPEQSGVITVRDLLCHQGGIVHYSNGPVVRIQATYGAEHPFENVITALDTFKESPLIGRPREKYSYSTHAYILLSAVVERAGQQPFAEQVHSRIVKPLKLRSLQPDYHWVSIPNRAVGYRGVAGIVLRSTNTDVSWKLGGGGYISDIHDLAAYAAAITNGELLSRQSWKLAGTVQSTADGKPTSCGLGFFVDGSGDTMRLSHNGSQEKAKTRVAVSPFRRQGIVLMSNSENVNPTDFAAAIEATLAGTK